MCTEELRVCFLCIFHSPGVLTDAPGMELLSGITCGTEESAADTPAPTTRARHSLLLNDDESAHLLFCKTVPTQMRSNWSYYIQLPSSLSHVVFDWRSSATNDILCLTLVSATICIHNTIWAQCCTALRMHRDLYVLHGLHYWCHLQTQSPDFKCWERKSSNT